MKIVLLSAKSKIPQRSTAGAAGFDLFSSEPTVIPASRLVGRKIAIGRGIVHTGIALAVPVGFVGRIGSRSGVSVEHNVEVGAGWIDADYRGEVLVELKNLGSEDFLVDVGARIAQLFILGVCDESFEVVENLPTSWRGAKGFGSTGR